MMKFKVLLPYCLRQVSVEILLEVLMYLVSGCNQLTNGQLSLCLSPALSLTDFIVA